MSEGLSEQWRSNVRENYKVIEIFNYDDRMK